MIRGGTRQVGLNTIMSSVPASSGVSFRPRPPTTTFIATGGGPSAAGTITRMRNSGMFTLIQRLSTGGGGSARIRSIVITMARTGVANGFASRAAVFFAMMPSGGVRFSRCCSRFTPRTSVASYSVSASTGGTASVSGRSPSATSSRRRDGCAGVALSRRESRGQRGKRP